MGNGEFSFGELETLSIQQRFDFRRKRYACG